MFKRFFFGFLCGLLCSLGVVSAQWFGLLSLDQVFQRGSGATTVASDRGEGVAEDSPHHPANVAEVVRLLEESREPDATLVDGSNLPHTVAESESPTAGDPFAPLPVCEDEPFVTADSVAAGAEDPEGDVAEGESEAEASQDEGKTSGNAASNVATSADPLLPKPSDDQEYYELYRLLVDTLDQVERNYVNEVDRRELFEAAIEGALRKLDPYSSYVAPSEMRQFKTSVENEFAGVGIQIAKEGETIRVLSPLVGTPAYKAGIVAGDRIIAIDETPTKDLSIDDAIRLTTGPPDTKVTLTVLHERESEPVDIEITRQVIQVETVMGDHRGGDDQWVFMLDRERKIGYVRLTAFSRNTAPELRDALEKLQKEKMRGLILDLRFNPGGLLTSAIKVSDMFVSSGLIVSTEGRNSPKRAWVAGEPQTFKGFPMVVLVNRFSASAAEIVAACLQDHDRAVIIGERTWGKGSVQNVIELEGGGSVLKLTTASYQRPNGHNIHRFPDMEEEDEWGVTPNEGYRVRLSGDEMFRLMQNQRDRDIVRPHETSTGESSSQPSAARPIRNLFRPGSSSRPATQPEPEETLPAREDRQLDLAIECVKKLIAEEEEAKKAKAE